MNVVSFLLQFVLGDFFKWPGLFSESDLFGYIHVAIEHRDQPFTVFRMASAENANVMNNEKISSVDLQNECLDHKNVYNMTASSSTSLLNPTCVE